jgi:hypothetical protein
MQLLNNNEYIRECSYVENKGAYDFNVEMMDVSGF